MKLTPYGFRTIAVCLLLAMLLAVVSGGLGLLWWPAALGIVPAVVFAGWTLWFFRDPERTIPDGPGQLVSPADGTVTSVGVVEEPAFIGGPAMRISIFMSIFSVHVNRAPVAGRVAYVQHREGSFVNAMRDDAADLNERNDLGLETDLPQAPRVLVRQVAGLIARRIICDRKVGDALVRGERFGMIRFGSRLDVFVPADSGFVPAVQIGQAVQAGATVLGEFTS